MFHGFDICCVTLLANTAKFPHREINYDNSRWKMYKHSIVRTRKSTYL